MERAGETVYSLCVGEPDYQPPQEVLEATSEAAQLGLTKYTAVNGEVRLRQAIAHDLSTRKSTLYSPEEILVSNGAKQAVIQALMAITCPGKYSLYSVTWLSILRGLCSHPSSLLAFLS